MVAALVLTMPVERQDPAAARLVVLLEATMVAALQYLTNLAALAPAVSVLSFLLVDLLVSHF